MDRKKKVGYTYYGEDGARHTGITNNPKRRRSEHNRNTGGKRFPESENWADDQAERPALGTGTTEHQGVLTPARLTSSQRTRGGYIWPSTGTGGSTYLTTSSSCWRSRSSTRGANRRSIVNSKELGPCRTRSRGRWKWYQ